MNDRRNPARRIAGAVCAATVLVHLGVPAGATAARVPSAAAQKISATKFTGGCTESEAYPDDIAMEQEEDPTCKLTVTLTGKTARVVTLQRWDDEEEKWDEAGKSKTVKGKAVLSIDPRTCGDEGDEYCDGTFEYRVVVPALKKPKLPAIKGRSFEVIFVSSGYGYGDEECDEDDDDCG